MRCLFTSDLHGRKVLFAQLEARVQLDGAHAVILGGDILCDAEPAQWRQQLEFVRGPLRKLLERLRKLGVREIGFLHGNHDWRGSDEALLELEQAGLMRKLPECGVSQFGNMPLVSYAYTPPSPYVVKDYERRDAPGVGQFTDQFEGLAFSDQAGEPREIPLEVFLTSRPTIFEDLSELVVPREPFCFVSHGPPKGSGADVLWTEGQSQLPEYLRLDVSAARMNVGSDAISAFIKHNRPVLSLHGHVHTSPYLSGHYVHRLATTWVINPGQRRERLHSVVFETDQFKQIAGTDQRPDLLHSVWGETDGPAQSGDQLPPKPSFVL